MLSLRAMDKFLQIVHAFTTFHEQWVSVRFVANCPADVKMRALDLGYVKHRVSETHGAEFCLTPLGSEYLLRPVKGRPQIEDITHL